MHNHSSVSYSKTKQTKSNSLIYDEKIIRISFESLSHKLIISSEMLYSSFCSLIILNSTMRHVGQDFLFKKILYYIMANIQKMYLYTFTNDTYKPFTIQIHPTLKCVVVMF